MILNEKSDENAGEVGGGAMLLVCSFGEGETGF
jgi:hypothetical protein